MAQKVAIVAMLRNADKVVDSFITYHLSIGFSKLFLFFDDPNDPSIHNARKYPNVTVIRTDDKLRQFWKKTRLYARRPEYRQFLDSQLRPRQMLNVEIGIQLALREQVDWLLHIDLDELFYLPGQTVQDHFQELTDRNIRHVVYRNYESITESGEVRNYFREATLFKKNIPGAVQPQQRAKYNRILKSIPAFAENFFLYYNIGKSAARPTAGMLPDSPHSFIFPDQQQNGLTDPNLEHNLLRTGDTKSITSEDGLILHYPVCGFEHFWRKYNSLGAFPDKWLGRTEISEIVPFHVMARNTVLHGDKEAARKFYEEHVVVKNQAIIDKLIENDLAERILEPSFLLAKVEPESLQEQFIESAHSQSLASAPGPKPHHPQPR